MKSMKSMKRYVVEFRRKRKKKTDYNLRIKLLSSGKPRLVVRKKLNNITAQIISYEQKGDKVLVSAHTKELEKFGWKYHRGNIPAAYLLGLLLGRKAIKTRIKQVIFDIGMHTSIKACAIYAVLKGVIDAGLEVPHNEKIFPKQEKIRGESISDYADKLNKGNIEKYKKQFSNYLKKGLKPEEITKNFEEVRNKIGILQGGKNNKEENKKN